MASAHLALSVPADVSRRAARKNGERTVRLQLPEYAQLYVERRANEAGESVEKVVTRLIAAGIDAETARADDDRCPDGRPHQRGTINVRHCGRCSVRMPS